MMVTTEYTVCPESMLIIFLGYLRPLQKSSLKAGLRAAPCEMDPLEWGGRTQVDKLEISTTSLRRC